MKLTTFDELPSRLQAAIREAMPASAESLDAWIAVPLPALGHRSIIAALEQDGYAAEAAIIECCKVMAKLRKQAWPVKLTAAMPI